MTPETYSELLKDLQKREKTLVPAYLTTLRADPALTAHFQARFEDAEVGGRFDDFALLCCRRSAVQFLLRTVYVRVLEDLGALDPPRIRGDWGFAAFREVAPALGVREYLKWTFRDLARDLPALFTPSPDELPLPSEDLCRETWDLWHRMSGDQPVYAWTADTFDSRFLGDLYQDLDAEVRKRFALLQTPEFVEKYILDHTLTPALKEFDPAKLRADGQTFRIIDPTCGSGHFLIGAFHRLFDYWQANGVKDPWDAAQRALESVWGCDINPHAVDIARFRLMLEVRACTGVTQLEKLASLKLNIRAMDSLIPWEGKRVHEQGDLFATAVDRLGKYATQDERLTNARFLSNAFHAVVGNPPYIRPKDPQKDKDYRLFWPDSVSGRYALSVPFVERFIALGAESAFIGQITSNSFAKRKFGKKLVESYLPKWDLTGLIDTSGAYIPGHGTPTVILFMRARPPKGDQVWSILGKRGEPKRPAAPENGLVWTAIKSAKRLDDDTSPFITVAHELRTSRARHPWSLGGGMAREVKEALEGQDPPLSLAARVGAAGITGVTGLDDVYVRDIQSLRRLGITSLRELVVGDQNRDWTIEGPAHHIPWMYSADFQCNDLERSDPIPAYLYRWKTILKTRKRFGTPLILKGASWFELQELYPKKLLTADTISFAFVSTNNQFVHARSGALFNRTSPVLKLSKGATADDHLDLCGLLNSSALGFWMRQVCHNKGYSASGDGGRTTSEDFENFFEYDATKLLKAPIVESDRDARIALARALDTKASERAACLPRAILTASKWAPAELDATLNAARDRYCALTYRMVALQEELDWLTYGSYKLIEPVPATVGPDDIEPLAPGHRPFEILFARADDDADDEEKSAWWSRHGHERVTEIPPHYSEAMRARIQARMDLIESDPKIQLIEQPAYKRRWQTPDFDTETKSAAESYLLDRLEDLFARGGPLANPTPYRLEQIVDAWARDPRTVAVARVWKGGDVDLTLAAEQLLRAHGLPDNPRRIYTAEGLRTLATWKKTWHLQDLEDRGEPLVDPDTGKTLDTIEIPPKFERGHFQSADAFSIRGKLNVPRERFIIFADLSPARYGWNGWRDTERARAQVDAYGIAESDPQDPLPPPTAADPRRCGPTLGLWESLPDVRRWDGESTHAEFLALAQEVCGQKSCPCDVVDAWQTWQAQQQQQARSKRPGRKASLPVVAPPPAAKPVPATAPAAPPQPADSAMIAVTIEDRGFLYRLIEPFGEGGATIADLTKQWIREPGFLARVLDDLIASGDLKTRGRGKKKVYIAASTSRTPET